MADAMTWMQNGADFVFGEQWAWSLGLKEVYRRMWNLQGHRHKSEGALSGL